MLAVFVITLVSMITGGNDEGKRDMLESTKDRDIILGNESCSLAFSLKFQAAPKEISFQFLSKSLDIMDTDSVNYKFQTKEVF